MNKNFTVMTYIKREFFTTRNIILLVISIFLFVLVFFCLAYIKYSKDAIYYIKNNYVAGLSFEAYFTLETPIVNMDVKSADEYWKQMELLNLKEESKEHLEKYEQIKKVRSRCKCCTS